MNTEKENIKNELSQNAPLLSGMEKQEHFKVPAHYFEGLQQRVLERIRLEVPVKTEHPMPLWMDRLLWLFQPQYAVAFATVVLIIVVSAVFQTPQTGIDDTNILLSEIPAETVTEYLAEAKIETDAISAQLNENDLTELEQQLAFYPTLERETLNELIHNIDESKIMEEFL